ncbi:DUF3375 domain-containing protein [Xenorhabdus doucetiae]|uniref:Uncharacterized protein DUF3375 n=1 Tax=Xenorhabdus doucetiae TaxID=351671 RepID=A0A068QNW9_9GAMM|nr:DUF3375 domain-containing protein [Xenorhabdus doucetiae]TYP08311.1 uncharacterized protein DUF3375 [Xenorhabdus doucetiae]CDG16276.1 conserved protein of unknown function [Xenorhabdus doucetiae]
MEERIKQRTESYISARNQHPAWLLLATRRAPLVLSCLKTLFEESNDGIPLEEAIVQLTNILMDHANQEQYEINQDNFPLQASRELREWIKRRLIVERDGRLFATDALEISIAFVETLDNRFMTSTASRLSTVQREIENLETHLNPNPANRVSVLRRRIADLERELQEAEAGHIEVLEPHQAIEHIREVFNLATSLRADFRRVEDSWREADRVLRQSIIGEQYHRGEIVDRLLNDQEALLNTPEGRVFDSFQQQLRQSAELTAMSERLRVILSHPAASDALSRLQRHDLRWLVKRLVDESQTVLQARARSERDVRGFMKTGLAAEHHRVGHLLNEFFNLALNLDWQRQAVRKKEVPLPAVGVAVGGLPIIERLRFKEVDDEAEQTLDLSHHAADLAQIGDDFWDAFNGLDREALLRQTLQVLAKENRPVSLAELAILLPPVHDLETFAFWIGMAKEAGIDVRDDQREYVELRDDEDHLWRFDLPTTGLESKALKDIDWE